MTCRSLNVHDSQTHPCRLCRSLQDPVFLAWKRAAGPSARGEDWVLQHLAEQILRGCELPRQSWLTCVDILCSVSYGKFEIMRQLCTVHKRKTSKGIHIPTTMSIRDTSPPQTKLANLVCWLANKPWTFVSGHSIRAPVRG